MRIDANFTADEMGLICRALSDSMNYKPNKRFDEKWALLLKCKQYQVRHENKKAEGEADEEEIRHNKLTVCMGLLAGCSVLVLLLVGIVMVWSSANPDIANTFAEFRNILTGK